MRYQRKHNELMKCMSLFFEQVLTQLFQTSIPLVAVIFCGRLLGPIELGGVSLANSVHDIT